VLVVKLSTRYAFDILFLLGGAFLAVAAMAFTAPVTGWVGFGVAAGLTMIAGVSAILTRNYGRKFGHGLIGVIGLWSLSAALIFSGTALTWLVFADALLLGAAAIGDLTANEVSTEHVVHRLEVTGMPERAGMPAGRTSAGQRCRFPARKRGTGTPVPLRRCPPLTREPSM
jgi:hypothetical protein